MGFPLDPLFHIKLRDKYVFTRQIDVLRNKIGIDVTPKYISY